MRARNPLQKMRMPGVTLYRLLTKKNQVEALSAHVGFLTNYRDTVPSIVTAAIGDQLAAANCKTVEGLVAEFGRDAAIEYLRETPMLKAFMSTTVVFETPENLIPLDPDFDFQ